MSLEERAKEWAALFEKGESLQQIADKYGVSRQRVHQVIRPLRIKAPLRPVTVRPVNPARGGKIWSVYIMAAPTEGGITYFKVGISSDVVNRICTVQTGCPLRISTVWAITTFNNGAAQDLEAKLHALLWAYRTNGEWFAMNINDLSHKRAMNEAFSFAVKACSNMKPVKWRRLDVPAMRKLIAEAEAERRSNKPTYGYDVWSKHRAGVDNWPA